MASRKPASKPAKMQDDCPVCHTNYCNSSFCGMACTCPVFGIVTTKAFWVAAVVAVIVMFGFDMLWHGKYMMPHYLATASMWRTEAEMATFQTWCYVMHGLWAMAYAALILLMGRLGTWWGAFITGVLAAAPVAAANLSSFIYMPFADATIPQLWAVGALVQGGLAGLAIKAATCAVCRK